MILSFGDKTTEELFNGVGSKHTRAFQAILKVVRRKLDMVNTASRLKRLAKKRIEKRIGSGLELSVLDFGFHIFNDFTHRRVM